jgi:hypothetical protein
MPACELMRVEGGRISYDSHYFDLLTLLSQIGAAGASPEQGEAA